MGEKRWYLWFAYFDFDCFSFKTVYNETNSVIGDCFSTQGTYITQQATE